MSDSSSNMDLRMLRAIEKMTEVTNRLETRLESLDENGKRLEFLENKLQEMEKAIPNLSKMYRRASTKGSLLSLPDELLSKVILYLNQLDLVRLRRLHSRLYKVTTKRLFQNIYVNVKGDHLLINANTYTPFYTKYTIINRERSFNIMRERRDIYLIDKIVCCNDSTIAKCMDLKMRLPHISVIIEQELQNYSNPYSSKLGTPTELYLSNRYPYTCKANNYSVTHLTINFQLDRRIRSYHDIGMIRSHSVTGMIRFLKSLSSLKLINTPHNVLNYFRSQGSLNDLKLRELSISNAKGDTFCNLTEICNVFNMENISSLELYFFVERSARGFSPSEFLFLASHLKSLEHLAMGGNHVDISSIISSIISGLQPNTLKSLCLYDQNYNDIGRYLVAHQMSIRRLYIRESHTEYPRGMEEFNRLYWVKACNNTEDDGYFIGNREHVREIRNILETIGSYPCLKHFVIEDFHYIVNWNEVGEPSINYLNTGLVPFY